MAKDDENAELRQQISRLRSALLDMGATVEEIEGIVGVGVPLIDA